jgi:prepilin-type N-terminal cleavage/methylation domain-containing protein
MRRQGFTLVELLVAIAVLGVVVGVLITVTAGTLTFSARVISDAERLAELRDVTGYMSDNIRRARAVLTDTTVNGARCNIADGPGACFALVVPEARNSEAIDTYLFLAYRIQPRSELGALYKLADAWADANTYVIQEYRRVICGPSRPRRPTNPEDPPPPPPYPLCPGSPAVPPTPLPTISGARPYLVLDGLAFDNLAQAFSYDPANRKLTLTLQVKQLHRGVVHFTPAQAPLELRVVRRN